MRDKVGLLWIERHLARQKKMWARCSARCFTWMHSWMQSSTTTNLHLHIMARLSLCFKSCKRPPWKTAPNIKPEPETGLQCCHHPGAGLLYGFLKCLQHPG